MKIKQRWQHNGQFEFAFFASLYSRTVLSGDFTDANSGQSGVVDCSEIPMAKIQYHSLYGRLNRSLQ